MDSHVLTNLVENYGGSHVGAMRGGGGTSGDGNMSVNNIKLRDGNNIVP